MFRWLAWLMAGMLGGSTALADVVAQRWCVGERGSHPQTVAIADADEGAAVITIDLKALPKAAAVRSARLLVSRDAVTGDMEEAMTKVEVFALTAAPEAGKKPAPAGGPLALVAPWRDSLDATDAVRRNTGGKLVLWVKALPRWQRDQTQLEILYDGAAPAGLAKGVAGLEALHRAGQTFITWKELDNPLGDKAPTLDEFKAAADQLEGDKSVRYRIYRHTKPIDKASIAEAELLAEVKPLSGYNLRGVSVDRLIYQHQLRAIEDSGFARSIAPGPFDGYNRKMPQMGQVQVGRLAIQDGQPLPPGTGLYVHQPAQAGSAHYAVVCSVNGTANLSDFGAGNSLAKPLAEQMGVGEPVFQSVEDLKVFYDYPGQRRRYVQWCAPPLANLPNQYYNWGLYVPPAAGGTAFQAVRSEQAQVGKPVPPAAGETPATRQAPATRPMGLGFYFHDWRGTYLRPRWPHTADMLLASTDDSPWASFAYGYHESLGTLGSFAEGSVRDYTARRIDAFFDWACRNFAIDQSRLSCHGMGTLGGTAALQYALRHPERFALVVAGAYDADPKLNPATLKIDNYPPRKTHLGSLEAVWGKKDWDLKTEKGVSIWQDRDLPAFVVKNPGLDLPVFSLGGGSSQATWPQQNALMKALMQARQPLQAEFYWGSTPPAFGPLWASRSKVTLVCVPTEDELNKTPWYKHDRWQKAALGYWSGGAINTMAAYDRQSLVETADKLEATLTSAVSSLTIRHAANLRLKPGQKVSWQVQPAPQDRQTQPAKGETAADDNGVLTLPGPLPRGKLTITRVP